MAAEEEEKPVPDSGALFTFGKSKFADNCPSKFWLKNDKPAQIACGDEHTVLVTENGKLYVFGSNTWGQLGIGSGNVINKPTCVKELKTENVKLAACGRNHTLISTAQGKVYSSGSNSEGQLGLGDTTERTSFHEITFFNTQYKIKQLSAGSNTSAVLTVDGKLFMWGENSEGQLGLANEKTVCSPCQVDIGQPISWISCGYYHSAFVTQNGDLYTFGEPENGKLGLPSEQLEKQRQPQRVPGISGKVKMVSCGGEHTIVVTGKEVYTFGFGKFGQLGHGTFIFGTPTPKVVDALKPHKIQYVACGATHTAVITDKGLLYTFGDGRYGKLGLGDENFTNQFSPTLCMNFLKFNVQSVASGGCHMLVFATPRSKESEAVLLNELKEKYLMVNGNGDLSSTLERSVSARRRRREKNQTPDDINPLTRTLPPLNGHLLESLPVTSKTVPSGLFQVRQASTESSTRDSAPVSKSEGENTKNDQVRSFSADDNSDAISQKSFGGTTDILNMTHALSMNRGSNTFSPIQKRKETKDEESEEEEEEEEEEEDEVEEEEEEDEEVEEEKKEDNSDDPKAEKDEPKTHQSTPETPVTPAQEVSKINQQQSAANSQTENEQDHPKIDNGNSSPENTTRTTFLEKTRKISLFKRRSTSEKQLQENKDIDASKENGREKTKSKVSKDENQNKSQENSKTTEQSTTEELADVSENKQDRKSKSTTCTLL